MASGIRFFAAACSAILIMLPAHLLSADSDEPSGGREPSSAAETDRLTAKIPLPDVALWDQDGRQVRFYSDLIKDKVVAINFIFTTCQAICPRAGANFAKLQQLMADRMGRDFLLISISIDPVTDTPERLKAWSEQFHAGPGWKLLTGPKADVEALLKALGVLTPSRDNHPAIVLLGNDASGAWVRTYGLTAASTLVDLITALGAAGPGPSHFTQTPEACAREYP